MFKPKFNYTHKIVNNLVEITSARELILNAYLVPKREISSGQHMPQQQLRAIPCPLKRSANSPREER